MKKNGILWLLLITATAVLTYSLLAVDAVGDHLQYVVEPAGDVSSAAADLAVLAEEWDTTLRAWTLNGFIQEAAMRTEIQTVRGSVTMYGENALTLTDLTLIHGRLFTQEELASGLPLALLDEQLALALFREADATGRTFTLGGVTYQVIGVTAHSKQVGDYADFGAYIPLLSGPAPDALLVQGDPLPGVGAAPAFFSVCGLWRSGGTFIDLGKETVAATLWARVLTFGLGVAALVKALRWLNMRARSCAAHLRRKLRQHYAVQLIPQMTGTVLAFLLGYALMAWLAVHLLDFILQVVYVFPEWVPAVPVEWSEISSTFWRVQQSAALFRELRTPELLRLRYFAMLIRICCAAAAILLAWAPRSAPDRV